jgi:hypothetical protein
MWSNTAPDYGTNAAGMAGASTAGASARRARPFLGMVAAALTIWVLFSLWIIAGCAGLPHPIGRVAMLLLALELGTLMIWSYGSESCDERTCAPLAQAAGIAARTDVPILAAAFLVVTALRLTGAEPARRRSRR